MYVHTLVVYVDDFNTPGPKHNLKKGWDLLSSRTMSNCRVPRRVRHRARKPYTDRKFVKRRKHTFNPDVPWTPDGASGSDAQGLAQGELALHAASTLMKLLCAARLACFVLLRPINSFGTSCD